MKNIIRSLAIFLVIAVFTGCSSKDKKAEAPQPQAAGSASPEVAVSAAPEEVASPVAPVNKEVVEPSAPKKDIPLDPKYRALTQALRSQSPKPGGVQEEAARILSVNSNDPVALNTLALLHLRKGRTGAAKMLILRALEKKPNESAGLYNNLGVALLEEGDRDGAMVQFKKAIQLDDRHPEALGNLGSLYAEAGDYLKASSLLSTAYKMNRYNVQVASNYALSLRASNDLEGARKVYEEALKLNSKDVNLLLNYAILLIDFMNKPKDGLDLVYKVKFFETQRKDVLSRANALEKKAKSELK